MVLDSEEHSPQQELSVRKDLCSIVHVFSCKLNGQRKYAVDGETSKAKSAGRKRKKPDEDANREEEGQAPTATTATATTEDDL